MVVDCQLDCALAGGEPCGERQEARIHVNVHHSGASGGHEGDPSHHADASEERREERQLYGVAARDPLRLGS